MIFRRKDKRVGGVCVFSGSPKIPCCLTLGGVSLNIPVSLFLLLLNSLLFLRFSLSLFLCLLASSQSHGSWIMGWVPEGGMYPSLMRLPMSTPFLHNSVPTHHPQLISLVQNCCNCSSRFHFRRSRYYYYSLGLLVFLGPSDFYYYFIIIIIIIIFI